MKNIAAVKLLLRLPKKFLIQKANEMNISSDGSKEVLAERIAEVQEKEQTRIWNAIANSLKKEEIQNGT